MANNIRFNIGFDVDKKGLEEIKNELKFIQSTTTEEYLKININQTDLNQVTKDLAEINYAASTVQNALDKAFNAKLDTFNIQTFNNYLKDADLTLDEVYSSFSKLGTQGQSAFRKLSQQILTTNTQLDKTSTVLDDLFQTLSNTVKWNVASTAVNALAGQVSQAFGYVKNLDSSLNDIRIVTGESAEQMDEFARKANDAAIALGQQTTEYTNSSLIYYQQGLGDEEAQERARLTLMAANVTGQDAQDVSEQLTAVWNAYKVNADEAEIYIDRLAVAAAATAADLEELSTGMSRVASTANAMGVQEEQLASMLATIISVTRQAPESVGTATNTILTRMADITADLNDEVSLDNYTKKMNELGINVLDANNNLREMGDVITEIGSKWTDLSREQQLALAQIIGGTHQFNTVLALFDNWDQYLSTLEQVNNAEGALQEQQDIYMESTRAHLDALTAQWEDLFDSLLDSDSINGVTDFLRGLVGLVTNLVDSLGGGEEVFIAFGSVLTRVFSSQISTGLNTFISNIQVALQNVQNAKEQLQLGQSLSDGNYDSLTNEINQMSAAYQKYSKYLTEAQKEEVKRTIESREAIITEAKAWDEAKKSLEEYYNTYVPADDRVGGDNTQVISAKNLDSYSEDELLDIETSLENAQDRFRRSNDRAKEFNNTINQLTQGLKQNSLSLDEINEGYRQVYIGLDRTEEAVQNYLNNLDQESQAYIQLNSLLDQYRQQRKRIIQEYGEGRVGEGFATDDKARISLQNLIRGWQKETANSVTAAEQSLDTVYNALAEKSSQINVQMQKSNEQVKALWKTFSQPEAINALTEIVAASGSALSIFTQIKQLGSIWTDENLSDGERFLQTLFGIVNIGGQAVSILSSIASISNAASTFSGIASAVTAFAAANPILIGVGVAIAAIGGVYVAATNAAEKYDEAQRRAFSESLSAVEENKTKIQELSSQLEDNRQKIEEINEAGPLSITDEQDIRNLQTQNELLSIQIDLEKQRQKVAYQDAANTYKETAPTRRKDYDKAANETTYSSLDDYRSHIGIAALGETSLYDIGASDTQGFNQWQEQRLNEIKEYREKAAKAGSDEERAYFEERADYMDQLFQDDIERWKTINASFVDYLGQAAQEATNYLALDSQFQDDEAVKEAQETIRQYYEATGTYQQKVAEQVNELITENKAAWEDFVNDTQSIDFNQIFAQQNPEQVLQSVFGDDLFDAIQQKAQELGLSLYAFLQPLTDDSGIINLQSIAEWINTIAENTESASSAADDYTSKLSFIKTLSQTISTSGISSITDEEDLKQLQELEKEYSGLADIQDKNSHDYLEALRYIQEQLEDNHRIELNNIKDEASERAKTAAQNLKDLEARKEELEGLNDSLSQSELDDVIVDIQANTNELQNAINDVISADYELKVSVNAQDLASDVSDAFDFATEISNIGQFITDDLKVSVDEMRQIVDAGYGAMLIDAQATTDGMVQLNAAQVNAFIDGKQSEVEASRQAYIAQLEQSLTYLNGQREYISLELQAVESALAAKNTAQAQSSLYELRARQNGYEHYVQLLSEQLSAEDDYRYQSENISDQLNEFKAQQSEIAYLNQQKDESDATTQQAQEVKRRIENLEKYYNSLVSIGLATKQAMSGTEVTVKFSSGSPVGGGGIVDSGNFEMQNPLDRDQSRDYAINTDFDIGALLDEWMGSDWSEAGRQELEDLRKGLSDTLASLDAQAGALRGSIEALKAADLDVDYQQAGSGSSGGKSGGSTPNQKELDLYNDRLDVFAAINEEIDKYEAGLEALQEAEQNAYGTEYANNLNKQLDLIKKLKEAQEERLEIAKSQESQLKDELSGIGFTFTDEGVLDRSRLTELKNLYDQAATVYNNMSGEQQQSEQGLALEQQLEDQKDYISQVETLIGLWEEAQKEGNDATTQISSYEQQIIEVMDKLKPGEQIELWEEFNKVIQEFGDITDLVDSKLSALSNEQDHLAGNDWIENINKQIDTLNLKKLTSVVDAVKDLGSVAVDVKKSSKDFNSLMSSLKELAKQNDKLAAFDINIDPDQINASADGIKYISDTLMQLFKAYNSMEAGQQGLNLSKTIGDILGVASGNILSIISLAVDVINIITNLADILHNIREQIIELRIEKFNKPVDVTLDLYDMQQQWNEFRRQVIDDLAEDDFVGKMKQSLREIKQYYEGLDFSIGDSLFDEDSIKGSMNLMDTLSSHLGQIMQEIQIMMNGEKSDIYGDHMQDALDDLKTYMTSLQDALIDVAELEDEIYQAYLDGWDDIQDGLQDQLDEYDRIMNEIEHNKNILSMLYGDDAYDQMYQFYELEEKANSGRLQYLTQTVAYWEQVRAEMEASGETSGEAWEKVVQAQKDAQEELNAALEEAIQTIIDKYQNTIAGIFNDMTDKLTGGMGLDYLSDQWDLINQRADKYLDDVNAAYAISELQAKVQDAINDNDGNVEAQEQIKDLMDEQLSYLKDKENLTQYDVERAEKLLDIELKRIALQNAQQNQTSMRLRRDANGNYSYEFVADEDAVSSAEQDLAAAENDLYNFDKDQYNQNLQEIFQMYQEYNQKVQEIASDNTLTEEERQKYILMLNEEYQNQITALVQDNETIRQNLTQSALAAYAELYGLSKDEFINMTEEQKEAFMSNLVETWDSGLQQMADAIAGEGGFESIANEALEKIKEAQDAYNESIEQTKEDIDGLDFTDFQTSIDNILATTEQTIASNESLINSYKQEASQLIQTNQQAQEYLATLQAQNQAMYEQIALAQQLYAQNAAGAAEDESAPGWFDALVNVAMPGGLIGNIVTGGGVSDSLWEGIQNLFGFDTGGYTGDWNDNKGKLAVLHEKELVLNKDDTENILSTVDIVRGISDSISDNLSALAASQTPVLSNPLPQEKEPDTLQQEVHITAEFPNATDKDEIMAAFDNLVNVASQRIMTIKK